MVSTPSHQQQEAEAAARQQAANTAPAGETAEALAEAEGAPQDPGPAPSEAAAMPEQTSAEKPLPPARSKFDEKRAEIVSRFRSERTSEAQGQTDEVTGFTHSGLPPEFAQPPQPQPPEQIEQLEAPEAQNTEQQAEPQPPAQAGPPKHLRLKVNGKELELPIEDVIAKAQIALASENILDKAKDKLSEVNALVEETRRRAAQPGPAGHHAEPNTVRPGPQPSESSAAPPNQEEQQKRLTEALQFGDPDEADRILQDTIAKRADEIVARRLYEERLRDEGARTAKVLKDFGEKHPEVASDEMARAAIEATMFQLQREDLNSLGLDPNRIRPDGLPASPADIANAHRHYRAMGMSVHSPEWMLETALGKYNEWKGIKSEPAAEAAPAPKAAPRIVVSPEREGRRQAVQPQPSRTAAPKLPQGNPPAITDRSAVVAQEKARRAKLRGQVLGA